MHPCPRFIFQASSEPMNVSGILVIVPPAEMDTAMEKLAALQGVDVHHTDPATGRIVVTQEAESIQSEVQGLKRIKALPFVILAEMVHHNFEQDREIIDNIPPEAEGRGAAGIPAFLEEHGDGRESS